MCVSNCSTHSCHILRAVGYLGGQGSVVRGLIAKARARG